eukprot:NODE_8249_length_418_cov_29.010840_g7381_i0.p1 GENE.NODE_8249_length_418_cov_29.010840_g7381_i0~~NODE_8249_length_418_cov_29.010840_g7381_i0.p1  ORF type:complete len:110 (+),score=33.05 NODE_8249_length_418_cov_29.010840_g7381_i0:49-330(+)
MGAEEGLRRRRRALTMAADKMVAGCEICSTHHITWVAINFDANGDGIVVCEECLAVYTESRAVYNLYEWFNISQLLTQHPGFISTLEADVDTS